MLPPGDKQWFHWTGSCDCHIATFQSVRLWTNWQRKGLFQFPTGVILFRDICNIWKHFGCHSCRRRVPVAPCVWRPRMLLNILQWRGQLPPHPPTKSCLVPNANSVKTPDLPQWSWWRGCYCTVRTKGPLGHRSVLSCSVIKVIATGRFRQDVNSPETSGVNVWVTPQSRNSNQHKKAISIS